MDKTIKDDIVEHAHKLLGDNFEFRPGQLDAIEHIINNTLSDTKHTVLEAPTGSGKSMVALVAAYMLWKVYRYKSYILVSDLSLFDQYANDIKKLNDKCFGYVKGKENYVCQANGCKVSQATCSLQNISARSMMRGDDDFSCAHFCQYVKEYNKAVNSPITLMTYQLYFIQRNYVEDGLFRGKNLNFPKRDLVICDEAHKICDICQAHFAPRISIERPHWMSTIDSYTHQMPYENVRIDILGKIELSKDNDELFDAMNEYAAYVDSYCSANIGIRRTLAHKQHLTKRDKAALAAGNMARQEHCKLEDMSMFIKEIGSTECLVKTTLGNDITINFVYDNLMLKKYFHAKSNCELLMSATIGDFNEYAKLTGLDEHLMETIQMPSTFDFSKSPIYVSQNNKMSAYEKDMSLKVIAKQVIDICQKHQNERGIIQTGSYDNSIKLRQALPSSILERCVSYDSNVEKKIALDAYMSKLNGILIGPTLIEGLNFPDNMCRFQICIKVPYAYLGSEYVKKKMKLIDGWYEYDVLNKIHQGIGRGVRHKDDWCETYILDGCIMNLFNKLEDIPTLSHRFKLYE